MLAKFAEDDRIEQMNAQKRRMKQLEHKRAVQALIEERREQFARERVGGAWIAVCIKKIWINALFYKKTYGFCSFWQTTLFLCIVERAKYV